MSEREFASKVYQGLSKSEDGLLACDTMQSFLRILDELGDGCSQKVISPAGNDKYDEKKRLSEKDIDEPAFHEHGAFSEELERSVPIKKFNEVTAHSATALHLSEMLLTTSMRHTSMFYKTSFDESSYPKKESSILQAASPTSKMLASKLIAASRISKGSTIMRSTGSTWMTKAPKSKTFPNFNTPVIDASIMNMKEDFTELPQFADPDFFKLINAATPLTKNDRARDECKGKPLNSEHIDATPNVKCNITLRSDSHSSLIENLALCSTGKFGELGQIVLKPQHEHKIAFDRMSANQNFRDITLQTAELFKYLSRPQRNAYEFNERLLQAKRKTENLGNSMTNLESNHLADRPFTSGFKKKAIVHQSNKNVWEDICIPEQSMVSNLKNDGRQEQTNAARLDAEIQCPDNSGLKTNTLYNVADTGGKPMPGESQNSRASHDLRDRATTGDTDNLVDRSIQVCTADQAADEDARNQTSVHVQTDCTVSITGVLAPSAYELRENIPGACGGHTDSASTNDQANEDVGDNSSESANILVDPEGNNETVEEQATVVSIDEVVDFGEESVFGILGVYCNSEIHDRYREVAGTDT